jgi:hypothetical protein
MEYLFTEKRACFYRFHLAKMKAAELYAASQTGVIYKIGAQAAIGGAETLKNAIINSSDNYVFPTVITNRIVTIVMKDVFKTVSITDMKGSKLFTENLATQTGSVQLSLPVLNNGMYILNLMVLRHKDLK